MCVTFPVTFSLTELKVGLTAVFISRIGTVIVKLSQPPPADACSHFKYGKQTGAEISVTPTFSQENGSYTPNSHVYYINKYSIVLTSPGTTRSLWLIIKHDLAWHDILYLTGVLAGWS